jgi:Lsr2
MAQRVQVILEDDMDGGQADGTYTFALEGTEYEIDLSSSNAAALKDALAPWISHARRIGGKRSRRGSAPSKAGADTSSSDIRAWAQAHGYEVSSRGRVSAQVKEAYQKAHA